MRQPNSRLRRIGVVLIGAAGLLHLEYGRQALAEEKAGANSTKRGVVHVVVFSNFEGRSRDAQPVIKWFDACRSSHPAVKWTHMYNPIYLIAKTPQRAAAETAFSNYLLEQQKAGAAEIGLHLHMYYELIEAMGISPRGYPYAQDTSPACNDPKQVNHVTDDGYDVLMTGYSADEQSKMIDQSIAAFVVRGFPRPKSFCAGYSAADPSSQAMLASKGINVSLTAQFVPPAHYGSCWEKLLKWSGNITPLTVPYRVSKTSILPPPHTENQYLPLVEVPLNLGVDTNELFHYKERMTREEALDKHIQWAKATGGETAVAIGVHAEVIGSEAWGSGPVSKFVDGLLHHAAKRANFGDVEIRFGRVSEVAARFYENKSLAGVPLNLEAK